MREIRVYLYYLGKGDVKLDIVELEPSFPELKDHYDQVRAGILGQFGGETRDLTSEEVLNIVCRYLEQYLCPSDIRVRFMYMNEQTRVLVLTGNGPEVLSSRVKTRFERMLQ